MPQIKCNNITVSHGTRPLIAHASCTIEQGEKVCIIGRNGMGKTTLLHALMGQQELDHGTIEREDALTISHMIQTVPNDIDQSVFDLVASGLDNKDLEDWDKQYRVDTILSRLLLDGEIAFNTLSGGLKRRVLLAKSLVNEPDVLILDEPTNHLDIDSIIWLEKFLKNYHPTVIFITHDRMLTERLANHIIEIDNGTLTSWRGNYSKFLEHKEQQLRAEEKANALFDKRLAQEEVWIRQGIKARRTRNEGRVRDLKKMREQRAQRQIRPGTISLQQHDIKTSGKIVFDVDNVSYSYDNTPIIKDFSTVVMRGDKIGIIGPNGAGKSTLLNLLVDKIIPSQGSVKHGTKLDIAYFDQQHITLDDKKTVQDNVGGGSDQVVINGNSKHIMSYLQDFLFSPERARSPVKYLSGGERNRVMLAKLFLKPSNVLILDEPTNDLDVETLELLEEQLANYQGTLLLVSHDRAFLNDVVSSTFVFEGEGKVSEYIGGYDDWLRQRPKPNNESATKKNKSTDTSAQEKPKTKKKLGFKEQRELNELPKKIEQLEKQLSELQQQLSDPTFYKERAQDVVEIQKTATELEQTIRDSYERWEALEK